MTRKVFLDKISLVHMRPRNCENTGIWKEMPLNSSFLGESSAAGCPHLALILILSDLKTSDLAYLHKVCPEVKFPGMTLPLDWKLLILFWNCVSSHPKSIASSTQILVEWMHIELVMALLHVNFCYINTLAQKCSGKCKCNCILVEFHYNHLSF